MPSTGGRIRLVEVVTARRLRRPGLRLHRRGDGVEAYNAAHSDLAGSLTQGCFKNSTDIYCLYPASISKYFYSPFIEKHVANF